MARAPVSKTGGCRFESCHSCQAGIGRLTFVRTGQAKVAGKH